MITNKFRRTIPTAIAMVIAINSVVSGDPKGSRNISAISSSWYKCIISIDVLNNHITVIRPAVESFTENVEFNRVHLTNLRIDIFQSGRIEAFQKGSRVAIVMHNVHATSASYFVAREKSPVRSKIYDIDLDGDDAVLVNGKRYNAADLVSDERFVPAGGMPELPQWKDEVQ